MKHTSTCKQRYKQCNLVINYKIKRYNSNYWNKKAKRVINDISNKEKNKIVYKVYTFITPMKKNKYILNIKYIKIKIIHNIHKL